MTKFCGKCGSPVPDGMAFCTACGAAVHPSASGAVPRAQVPAPVPSSPAPAAPYEAPPQFAAMPPAAPAAAAGYPPAAGGYPPAVAAKSGSGLKIVLIILGVLALGGLAVVGGLIYVGHTVVTKIKDKAAEEGLSTSDLGKKGTVAVGDPCRFLSKDDVSKAIGVTILETKSEGEGCSYLAKGTQAEMTSKHLSAMLGQRGADAKTQDTIQKVAGGFFGMQQQESHEPEAGADGMTPVLTVSLDETSARAQMKLDSKVLGALGGGAQGTGALTGIGDEAFVSADGMLQVRKGDTLIRFMYINCPCSTEQITPLARKMADAL